MTTTRSQIPGAAIYLASFFLPAVGTGAGAWGWLCAWLALTAPFGEVRGALGLLLLGSGLINVLVLAYAGARAFGARVAVRFRIALITLCLVPMSWIAIALLREPVRIGHVVWIAGLLLIMLPDVIAFFRGEK